MRITELKSQIDSLNDSLQSECDTNRAEALHLAETELFAAKPTNQMEVRLLLDFLAGILLKTQERHTPSETLVRNVAASLC
jgi:hypothetical protein